MLPSYALSLLHKGLCLTAFIDNNWISPQTLRDSLLAGPSPPLHRINCIETHQISGQAVDEEWLLLNLGWFVIILQGPGRQVLKVAPGKAYKLPSIDRNGLYINSLNEISAPNNVSTSVGE